MRAIRFVAGNAPHAPDSLDAEVPPVRHRRLMRSDRGKEGRMGVEFEHSGRTGVSIDRPVGPTYLFAVVVDCGKGYAQVGWPIRASDVFLVWVEKSLGKPCFQVGDISSR